MNRCAYASIPLLLAACGGRTPFGGPGGGIVQGTVVDDTGSPFAGLQVRVDSTVTVTDELGHFTAPASAIYDVVIVAGNVFAYRGISRRDPVFKLEALYSQSSMGYAANVAITFPAAPSQSVKSTAIIALKGDTRYTSYRSSGWTGNGPRQYVAVWGGPDTVGLGLYALQYEADAATGAPSRYLAFDTLERSLAPRDRVDWKVDWKPMPYREVKIETTVSLPAGYSASSADLFAKPESSGSYFWCLTTYPKGPEVSFLVPDWPGFSYALSVWASSPESSTSRRIDGLTPSSASPPLQLEAGPRIVSPPDGATGVGFDTDLIWENTAHGASFVTLVPDAGSPDLPFYYLFTNGTSVRIPDVSELGIALPHQAAYEWAAFVTTSDGIDELAPHGTENSDLPERTYAYTPYRKITTE